MRFRWLGALAISLTLGFTSPLGAQPPRATDEPVDLPRAVTTDLAISSVYRGQGERAPRLVDGELGTAWCSRSGDLIGAWIEVRLPDAVSVTSIRMTAGFTGEERLFGGNHRVSRVRVSRGGVELGIHSLDPGSPALQTIPVTGPGGVYRIEVVEVVRGSRRDWRETCVSELRVMGRAPGARPGQRFPRWAVGELSAPRPAPEDADRADVRRRFEQVVGWLGPAWRAYDDRWMGFEFNTGEPDPTSADLAFFSQTRWSAHLRAAEALDAIDGVRADALRRALLSPFRFR